MAALSRLNKRLKRLLFHTLLQQELHFFEENNPGGLSSRLHSDVDRMGRSVALSANMVARSAARGALMLAVMWSVSWELTALCCLEMPVMAAMQNKYIALDKLVTLGIKVLMLVQARALVSSGRLGVGGLVSFLLYQKSMSTNLRLQTAEQADHIVFLEKGVVVEEGTHQQLMARRGRYHRFKEELFSQPVAVRP
ncbi:Antigen peptide transporter 2 [Liparis tanakae]|uniref:Antigen peptide transporter 2 n=1 Tax=Liparis tanakae TaxID=230148 RepID=A0A4Z2EIQ3_9TELE|nr:Antigen peptide transporter 2 [Liparis tanakae]